jgi:hypothetical protein
MCRLWKRPFRGYFCPTCYLAWQLHFEFACGGCGRICLGNRWCCMEGGQPFIARRHKPMMNPHCPVCEPEWWCFPLLEVGY